MNYFYGLVILTLTLTSFRLGAVALFDILMIIFILISFIVNPNLFFKVIYNIKFFFIIIFLYFLSYLLSLTQTFEADSHFSRTFPFIGVIILTWWFAYYSSYVFKGNFNFLLNFLLLSLTLGSCSVINEGLFFKEVIGDIDVSRQIGWMEHPIEAGYVASYGVVISIWLLLKTDIKYYIMPLILNLYSIKFSASMTALFGLIIAASLILVFSKRGLRVVLPIPFFLIYILNSTEFKESFLYSRIINLFNDGASYDTLDSRLSQNDLVLSLIDTKTIFLGKGYSYIEVLRAGGLDIHNGLLASIYHFGIFGFLAQILSIFIIALPIFFKGVDKEYKILLIAILIVFMAAYLTGPSMSRRTLWFPCVIISSVLVYFFKIQKKMKDNVS